jgi:hypothetical protein
MNEDNPPTVKEMMAMILVNSNNKYVKEPKEDWADDEKYESKVKTDENKNLDYVKVHRRNNEALIKQVILYK